MHSTDENGNIDVDEIFEKIESYFGFVPKIFQVLAENPPALKAYYLKSEVLMKDDALPLLTKEFVSIGASAALGAEHCLLTHLKVAKQFGAADEQLLLAILIGSIIAETDALAKSLRVYEEFKGTGNQEITLERDIAEKRVFRAINIKKYNFTHDSLLQIFYHIIPVVYQTAKCMYRKMKHKAWQAIDNLCNSIKTHENNCCFII